MEHQDRIYPLIDERGLVYSLVGDPESSRDLRLLASSFERALEYLVRGLAPRRAILEDLESIGRVEETWHLGPDPRRGE